MNILFVSNAFKLFADADCGGGNRTSMFITALAQLGHVDVISFDGSEIRGHGKNVSIVHHQRIDRQQNITKWSRRRQMCIGWLKLLFHPLQPESYFPIDRNKEVCIDSFMDKKEYDLVACRYIETAASCGLLKYSSKLVIDVDDRLSSSIRRDIDTTVFSHIWEKWFLQFKTIYIDKMVENVLRNVVSSFYSNSLEKVSAKSVFLHNVSLLTTPCPFIVEKTPKRLLIVGHLNFPPNKQGTLYFAETVFPQVRDVVPDAELHIVGRNNDTLFAERLSKIEGVFIKGFVEDIRDEYENARAVIVPIYTGSGSSVKFVEALQLRKAIISTPCGIRGYENIFKDREHYILSENDRQFSENCILLLNNHNLCNRIAEAGCSVAKEHLSQSNFISIVENTIKSSMNKQ